MFWQLHESTPLLQLRRRGAFIKGVALDKIGNDRLSLEEFYICKELGISFDDEVLKKFKDYHVSCVRSNLSHDDERREKEKAYRDGQEKKLQEINNISNL